MSRRWGWVFALSLVLAACSSVDRQGTIAQLRDRQIDVTEEMLSGGLEKAMASYQRFLQDTPDSPMAPEAIRRLADLKVEKEYGLLTGDASKPAGPPAEALPAPERAAPAPAAVASGPAPSTAPAESDAEFARRASGAVDLSGETENTDEPDAAGNDLERAGALEAIALYRKLLEKYPGYRRNDQVLYQMSRAYEELGRIEEAMEIMDRLARDFPESRYFDEIQFRRAESFFTRRHYLDAEEAYQSIVALGVGSSFYPLALYKLGWTFYKQELYEEALPRFIALLDYKVDSGYDFAQAEDEAERKRMKDTFRVISLSFSNLGGSEAVVDYFARHGRRGYEDEVYSNLGEYYFDKRRYSDAAGTYNAFVSRNPFHEKAPLFDMRVIDIHLAGGFPSLVIDAKKAFATRYGLQAEYWRHFDPAERPDVLGLLQTNLTDLANHYHARYQDPKHGEERAANFAEALHWYRQFLDSFPDQDESPVLNYQLADLLMENGSFAEAAAEYERTAYDYPRHAKSATAGYAAVYARRQQLAAVPDAGREPVLREVVRSSLAFAETFPEHDKAAIVLGAAADDLYDLGDFQEAAAAARRLIEAFPDCDPVVLRGAWLVAAHSSYELELYAEAEAAYLQVLVMLPETAETRAALVDNLAAAIYKQGEAARAGGDFRAAADHFLRVGTEAPTSTIRPTAEYDAAAALIQLKDWTAAATVLEGFRSAFPDHELQPEVTKKIAFVYRQDGRLARAADEYERIERESQDNAVRREALEVAAELHEEVGNRERALQVYRRYVAVFPEPVESNLETRQKIAVILKERQERQPYLEELRQIVAIEAAAGAGRTDRTRYLAAKAGLVLAEDDFERFAAVELVEPFEANLQRKKERMKIATKHFGRLLDYRVGEVTAAATYYLAEIYGLFSKALMVSERPDDLTPMELEQYELAIEEQAYPFEERAITVHESNLELISRGIYNGWIDKSLQKLAKLVPARYAKPEEESAVIASPGTFTYAVDRPAADGSLETLFADERPAPVPEAAEPLAALFREEGTTPTAEKNGGEKEPSAAPSKPTAAAAPPGGKMAGGPLEELFTKEERSPESAPARIEAKAPAAPVAGLEELFEEGTRGNGDASPAEH